MGFNPTRFVYVIQAQQVEDEDTGPYLLPEAFTSRTEARKRMVEVAESFLKNNPEYEALDGVDINFDDIELHHKDPSNCYTMYLEVLELELYDTLKESKGETEGKGTLLK